MNTLVIGGTSGLGLELARAFKGEDSKVYVTGRRDFDEEGINYIPFDLSQPKLAEGMKDLVDKLPTINTLIYAAGYFQEGRVTDINEDQIEEMISVGGRGLIYAVKYILEKQVKLDELITITSTSAWTPRQKEPLYNFVKAGAGHFSNGLAEDGRIAKVLVAGPAGMDTNFWAGIKRDDKAKMLDPVWVARQIMEQRQDDYRYKFVRILRDDPRVELVETR